MTIGVDSGYHMCLCCVALYNGALDSVLAWNIHGGCLVIAGNSSTSLIDAIYTGAMNNDNPAFSG